ncbi:hypothetical protein [Nodularia sp. UHCC 0506]|uniref:hypothetical protein n=1 Tax=Nodularia sp. UHCC 0506 TaxID=3110243 RepID=UPI002B220A84|nr:hypothetical protein [Nodularia sp. UHCC 0506]MEA5514890.1 hypothetical protein [Nodularia sp. UHCC 0506]
MRDAMYRVCTRKRGNNQEFILTGENIITEYKSTIIVLKLTVAHDLIGVDKIYLNSLSICYHFHEIIEGIGVLAKG